MTAWRRIEALGLAFPERGLVVTVRGLLALVVVMPLVTLPGTVYPFVVGKALYARVLIAAAFACWAVLALARPAWRPPRSALLVVLAAWLVVGLAAAAFGVSPQRSIWSYYPRMQGMFDMVHWVAFAVMAAAVLRTPLHWRRMLCLNQAVGLAAAAHAIVRAVAPASIGAAPLGPSDQVFGLMGNPAFLGAYLQGVALLAAAFLAGSFRRRPVAAAAASGARPPPEAPANRWPGRVFHGLTLGAALWALLLAGSMGAMVGFAAGLAAGGVLLGAVAGDRRLRRAILATAAAAGLVVLAAGSVLTWRAVTEGVRGPRVFDNVLLERITSPYDVMISAGGRLDNWQAGVAAFAERPLLGWGPDNYIAAAGRHLAADSGRYLPSRGAANEGRDHAHNVVVEEAATKGLAGVAAYLALWGLTAVAAVRAARRASAAERAMLIGVAAALAGWFVQSLTWFYFSAAWMAHMLLLACLARHAAAARPAAPAVPPAFADRPAPGRLRSGLRAAAGGAAVALAAGSLGANMAVHAGAAALYRAETGGTARFMVELEAGIRAFEPMATYARVLLFENVAANWRALRSRYPAEAKRLLAWAEREQPRALAAEPRNWRVHHALAHLYREVAQTEPGYAEQARAFHASALAAAPNLDPLLPMRPPRE